MPELRTARENARLEIGSQRGRNSHHIDVLGIYDLQGLGYGRTELLVADMRLLEPDPSGTPRLIETRFPLLLSRALRHRQWWGWQLACRRQCQA